ncbi:MAG: inositol monophosphatase family protein [Parachlamydiales bacterium]|jgi:myo-inositol-1(or 4)-monophosphatase
MPQFSQRLLKAQSIVLEAGKILKTGFLKPLKSRNKAGVHNLVTAYDLKVEKFILSALKKLYPNDLFIAEETGFCPIDTKKTSWILDPLDGTVNFVHGLPFFNISLAARDKEELVLAIVFAPVLNELFVAEKGRGAFFNQKRIQVSKCAKIEKAFLATGFPYHSRENPENCLERFYNLAQRGLPIRRLGAAALDLCYVACGKFDAFWETGLGPWDCAAGALLIEEANGKVSNWKGEKWQIGAYNTILASNGLLQKQMVQALQATQTNQAGL